jgi:hypothetical protein
VLGLYRKFHDRWFLEETFQPLLQWNRWWATHRDVQGYLTWGSDGENTPVNLDDRIRGTRAGAILESGLDNSPMYDSTTYNSQSHLLDFADVGLMSMYIADCDALATMADTLDKPQEARELRERSARYRAKLGTLWSCTRWRLSQSRSQYGQVQPSTVSYQFLSVARKGYDPRPSHPNDPKAPLKP